MRLLILLLIVAVAALPAFAQEPGQEGDESAVRSQLRDVGERIVEAAQLNPGSSVVLAVDAAQRRTIVENAFLESLQKRGVRAMLEGDRDSVQTPILRISDVRWDRSGPPDAVLRTELDARVEDPGSGAVRYLGHFVSDTQGKAIPAVQSETILGKILEPLVVISGTVLIVYLFFTVRS